MKILIKENQDYKETETLPNLWNELLRKWLSAKENNFRETKIVVD